jgi:hypothetical protein
VTVSEPAIAAANQEPGLAEKVSAYVTRARELASDGLSVADFAELATSLLRLAVAALDSIPADGEQKKLWAVAAVASLFDAVADKCVPMYALPFWVILRPAIRSVVLLAAGGVVQSLLPLVRAST